MDRKAFAAGALLIGLALGLVGMALFYDRAIGLSFPIFISLVLLPLLVLATRVGLPVQRRNLWPLLPLLFFAGMVAVRADALIGALNIAAALTLGALMLHYLPSQRQIDTDSLGHHTAAVTASSILFMPYAVMQAGLGWSWLSARRHERGGAAVSVVRGLMFALPVIVIFAFLLGSADAVFANVVNQAFNGLRDLFGLQYLDDTLGRLVFAGALAIFVTGTLGYGLMRSPAEVEAEMAPSADEAAPTADATTQKNKPGIKLSMIESGIILGSVAALFGLFVAIQFTYFFGGQTTLEVTGLSYAQYARRGFFELVAVSVLTLGLSLLLDRITIRQERRENLIFRGLALLIVGLTTIMLISAAQRMYLYEEAFGFTQLRVYVHVAIVWMGVLFGVFALALFRLRPNIFSFGLLLVIIGYLATLNLMNVDAYIAERNIARYQAGQELDIAFLNILSEDAVPVIAALYQQTEEETVRQWAGQWLARQLNGLNWMQDDGLGAVNLGRGTAWSQLSAISGTLPDYDPSALMGISLQLPRTGRDDYESGWDSLVTPTGSSR